MDTFDFNAMLSDLNLHENVGAVVNTKSISLINHPTNNNYPMFLEKIYGANLPDKLPKYLLYLQINETAWNKLNVSMTKNIDLKNPTLYPIKFVGNTLKYLSIMEMLADNNNTQWLGIKDNYYTFTSEGEKLSIENHVNFDHYSEFFGYCMFAGNPVPYNKTKFVFDDRWKITAESLLYKDITFITKAKGNIIKYTPTSFTVHQKELIDGFVRLTGAPFKLSSNPTTEIRDVNLPVFFSFFIDSDKYGVCIESMDKRVTFEEFFKKTKTEFYDEFKIYYYFGGDGPKALKKDWVLYVTCFMMMQYQKASSQN